MLQVAKSKHRVPHPSTLNQLQKLGCPIMQSHRMIGHSRKTRTAFPPATIKPTLPIFVSAAWVLALFVLHVNIGSLTL